MAGNVKNIASAVRAIAEPLAETLGVSVWDVEYVKEGADMYLRITIDKPEGIDINDCERFHRAIDPLLDEADPIEDAYHLEVSSPGIERELRTPAHLAASIGEKVSVKLYAADETYHVKRFVGTLVSYDAESDSLTLLPEGLALPGKAEAAPLILKRAAISKINIFFDFNN